jgi:7,8-dihydro-6-hydroxymethylpterin dimethyltransferase
VGWRNIVEKMHMTSTLTKWYEEHGRHEIFAGGKKVGLETTEHTLRLVDEHVQAKANDTLDKLGIAKNARQEKFKARDEKVKAEAEKARMMALYKEHVLGEKPVSQDGFVPLDSLGGMKPAPAVEEKEAVYGD